MMPADCTYLQFTPPRARAFAPPQKHVGEHTAAAAAAAAAAA